jgi:RNA polymerase sigma-70 factor (ECF subfamily)
MINNIRVQHKEEYQAPSTDRQTVRRSLDIAQLINKAANGDAEAFGDIYDIYLNRIYRYVFYQVKVKTLAEDLTEDIFIKIWKAIGGYKGDGPSFQTWLYRIAHNHITDYFRSNHKIAQLDEEISIESYNFHDKNDPQELAEMHLTYKEILEQVSLLPTSQRQIIVLKFIEGLENREIEQITGKKQGAIRIMQMRALDTLNKQLHMT